jgi:phytanoyl-CoA hydroxylase
MCGIESYRRDGYCIARNLISHSEIDRLLSNFVSLVNQATNSSFSDALSPELAEALIVDRNLKSTLYNDVRKPNWLVHFSSLNELVTTVRSIAGENIALMSKIPLRIDAPRETSELAVWHQDYFYVKGNSDVVTAWIPLQDTTYLNGCLSVMPRSHTLGPVAHDGAIGKHHFPTKYFDREIRLVEMNKGDVLFFHSALIHTGNINLSKSIRYSVQARYSPANKPIDKDMGEAIQL